MLLVTSTINSANLAAAVLLWTEESGLWTLDSGTQAPSMFPQLQWQLEGS
jgi:hypothetical protein